MPSRLSTYGTTKSPRSQSRNDEIYDPQASSQTSIKISSRSPPNSSKIKQRSGSLTKASHNKQNEEVARPQTRSGSGRSTGRGSNNDQSRTRPSTVTKGRVAPAADDEIADNPSTTDDPQANLRKLTSITFIDADHFVMLFKMFEI